MVSVMNKRKPSFADVLAAIQIHGEDLIKTPNVLIVRPGYRFRDGRFIPEPVVSITVLRKVDPDAVPAHELIRPTSEKCRLASFRLHRNNSWRSCVVVKRSVCSSFPVKSANYFRVRRATLAGAENNDPPLAAMTLNYVPPTHPAVACRQGNDRDLPTLVPMRDGATSESSSPARSNG